MKKRALSLLIGVVGLFAVSNAQTLNQISINGSNAAAIAAGPISFNSVITYNGQRFYIVAAPAPRGTVQPTSVNITSELATAGFTILGSTIPPSVLASIPGGANFNASGNAFFSTSLGDFTVTQVVPFDFGISAVLGAGALAAVRAARKRRKENVILA